MLSTLWSDTADAALMQHAELCCNAAAFLCEQSQIGRAQSTWLRARWHMLAHQFTQLHHQQLEQQAESRQRIAAIERQNDPDS